MDLPSGLPLRLPKAADDHLRSMGCVSMLNLLECDSRPSFVLDTSSTNSSHDGSIMPVYWNPAMTTTHTEDLLSALAGVASSANGSRIEKRKIVAFPRFESWLLEDESPKSKSFIYHGFVWTKILVASRWKVVNGVAIDAFVPSNRLASTKVASDRQMLSTKNKSFDWTGERPPEDQTPFVAWARSIDWASTSLGPMSSWSPQLRSISNLMLRDPRPSVLFWGPDLIMVYNEAYIEPLGALHPCMGVSARVGLAEVWSEHFEPIVKRNMAGETVVRDNMDVTIVRNGFLEETYFTLRFMPVLDAEGSTVGFYEPLVETTREVISQRHSRTLLSLSGELPRARDTESYWELATDILSRNDKDIPFAMLYSAEADEDGSVSSRARHNEFGQKCTLQGSFGLPNGSPAASAQLDLKDDEGFPPYLRQSMAARGPITVRIDRPSPLGKLFQNVEWQGFGDPCRAAIVCPLQPTSSGVLGFLVLGLNPRRPYDTEYQDFFLVTSRLLSTSLTSILLHEEDIGRRERAIASAEAMKRELEQQLLESQKATERHAFRFKRFIERADVGVFILGMDGVYTYRNDAWYSILKPANHDIELADAWSALIDDEYALVGQRKFEALSKTKQHQSFELRLKNIWNAPGQGFGDSVTEEQPMWVLCSISPELDENGEVSEIVGTITDISQQKWGEKLQATQASRAHESKRQLENFIDTTSHEMRNPLSAIVQCADSIIASHEEFGKSADYHTVNRKLLETTVDAAETIVQCSKHMKTIVDDVLTMSKLDSGLFIMTPVDVQLESIARDAVKMFEGEAKSAGVGLVLQIEESCKKSRVDHISLDPTRVLQVLINLVTNAIKFTRLEKIRHITVSLGISFEEPNHNADGHVSFLRGSGDSAAKTLQADWEKGEPVYIIFSVQDTGRGLSDADQKLLFTRFSQASPRTHIDYGGSGLGLFISRRLTQMHGGAIGFSSKAGVGSTFSFYVKSRRSDVLAKRDDSFNAAAEVSIKTQVAFNEEEQNQVDKFIGAKFTMNGLYILVVEDNLVNQRVLAKQLRNIGVKVAVANHGGEALEYIRKTNYCVKDGSAGPLSLVLMDWEMPVMDGLTCVRKIRELQSQGTIHGHIPVIAVTANVRSEQVKIALDAGMDDLISKPFRIPELEVCIKKLLDRSGSV